MRKIKTLRFKSSRPLPFKRKIRGTAPQSCKINGKENETSFLQVIFPSFRKNESHFLINVWWVKDLKGQNSRLFQQLLSSLSVESKVVWQLWIHIGSWMLVRINQFVLWITFELTKKVWQKFWWLGFKHSLLLLIISWNGTLWQTD